MNNKRLIRLIVAVALIVGLFWFGRFWNDRSKDNQTKSLESSGELISEEGIHWHPELSIIIKGQKQPIPANIGIGMQFAGYSQYDPMMMMTNMHTHDASGQLHWEIMKGPVKSEDVKLSQLFSVWGKKFNSSCIFDSCNGNEGRITFEINGKENPDFENYLVRDKDKIEIIFE